MIGSPTLYVTNGLFENTPQYQPLLFSWASRVRLAGEGWVPNGTLTVHLYGPLNTPGATLTDRVLGPVYTDAQGRISPGIDYDPVVEIPFDDGAPGTPHVTRPKGVTVKREPGDDSGGGDLGGHRQEGPRHSPQSRNLSRSGFAGSAHSSVPGSSRWRPRATRS